MDIQESVSYTDFISFEYTPRSGIVRLYGGFIFSFLRNIYSVFCSDYINLHSHKEYIGVPFLLYSCKHMLFFCFLIMSILTRVRWNLKIVLTYISLIAKDIEFIYIYWPFNKVTSCTGYGSSSRLYVQTKNSITYQTVLLIKMSVCLSNLFRQFYKYLSSIIKEMDMYCLYKHRILKMYRCWSNQTKTNVLKNQINYTKILVWSRYCYHLLTDIYWVPVVYY
jgi:hypothetical protein